MNTWKCKKHPKEQQPEGFDRCVRCGLPLIPKVRP